MKEKMTETPVPVIRTARMELVPVTPESLLCQTGDMEAARAQLARALKAEVTNQWPPEHWEPHVVDYLLKLIAEHPDAMGWCRYLFLQGDGSKTLIGTFGCSFPDAKTGSAELGYGILPAWQRHGFAAEAVLAMMPWLQAQREISAFTAQTFPHLYGSIRVLEKCGFIPSGEGEEPGAILFRRVVAKHRRAPHK